MKKNLSLTQTLPYILLVGGIIGVFSAGKLIVEKIYLLQNPGAQLGCDLNPVVACGSVITTPQASLFGFPNPIIGLVGFSAVAFIGLGMLAGARYKRWFWLVLQVAVSLGVAFVFWLQFQGLYRINALCPYCMVVWAMMIPIFWYVTLYNFQQNHFRVASRYKSILGFIQRHHGDILFAWFLIIVGAILHRFWYYWSTVI